MTGRQEHIDADIDEQAAFDFSGDGTGDDLAFFDRLHHLLPGDDLLGLPLAERDHAIRIVGTAHVVFEVFDEDLKSAAFDWLLFRLVPLVERNDAFTFKANVHKNVAISDSNDATFDDLVQIDIRTVFERRKAGGISPSHGGFDFGGQRVIVFQISN